MSLRAECKQYLDISDTDRDAKIDALLNAGYSAMTNTADVLAISGFSPSADPTPTMDALVKIALFTYVAAQLETDPDLQSKFTSIFERQVNTLAMSSKVGDYSQQ